MKLDKSDASHATIVVFLFTMVLCIPLPAMAVDFELITVDEYQQALDAGDNPDHDLIAKSAPGGPAIKVVSPVASNGTLVSPVDIEVQFESFGGANIDMSSLKIYYLMFFKKDITERILEKAELDNDTLRASGAKLPSGKHKFLVEIADSKKRKGSQKFLVEVGG